jgi:hypothetical protein
MIDKKVTEILKEEGSVLSRKDFDFLKNHKDVSSVENERHSGRRPEEFIYDVKLINGENYNIYRMVW